MFQIANSTATNTEQFIQSNRLMQCWQALSSNYSHNLRVCIKDGKYEVAWPEEYLLHLVVGTRHFC